MVYLCVYQLILIGISSHVLPSSVRPARFFRLQSAAGAGVHAAPLFKEKWDFGCQALIPNIRDPFLHDRSCAWVRLAAVNSQQN
jgi:hypothetical protein